LPTMEVIPDPRLRFDFGKSTSALRFRIDLDLRFDESRLRRDLRPLLSYASSESVEEYSSLSELEYSILLVLKLSRFCFLRPIDLWS